jgi:class 3 adenylate cyclase
MKTIYETEKKEKQLEIEHLRNVELKQEKDRSESLLLNILPAEVAGELKEKGSAEAKLFENVTVLFTDFKDFTRASERLTPQQLVNELDACFKAFDGIIGKYNLEKIKTVGDAYLAVAGLPLANSNHAVDMVNAALEIRNFMLGRKSQFAQPPIETFEIRIGLNSGQVVAGIVGIKKFAYDIWGDTVNTAARMEQNGEAGKVNISQTTYVLVKDKFNCTHRGKIEAKNKGEIDMYFVEK